MLLERTPNLQDIRTHMLNNILWTLVVIAGISVAISIASEFQQQRYMLTII